MDDNLRKAALSRLPTSGKSVGSSQSAGLELVPSERGYTSALLVYAFPY